MTVELTGTGVELRLVGESPHSGEDFNPRDPRIEAQCFVEVVDGPRRERWGGSTGLFDLPGDDEGLTSGLLGAAHRERDGNLGGLLGDLRRAGYDVTRWEFYSLPFRVELSEKLREFLSGRWRERDPRAEGEPIVVTRQAR